MNKHRIHILIVLSLTLLAACGQAPIPTSDATPTPPPPPTVAKRTVAPAVTRAAAVSGSSQTVAQLPEGGAIAIGAIGNADLDVNTLVPFLQSALYDSLLRPNPETGALEPGLAESYQVSSDAATITFKLRQGVHWHNGDALTAADVAATINALANPDLRDTPVTDLSYLKKATAPDDRTVVVSLSEGYCPALTSIGTLKILPRAVAESSNFPVLQANQLIGTGPLKLVSTSQNLYLFEPNRDYYLGVPHIGSWTLKLYSDANAMRAAFDAKQIDLMVLEPREASALKGIQEATVLKTASPEPVMLLFNLESVALNDLRVRQAVSFALDRGTLLKDIGGQGEALDTSALPNYWALPKGLASPSFDVARAKQLLGEAGWNAGGDGSLSKGGRPLTLELWTEADDPVLEPLAFGIREMIAALGINVQMELDDQPGWITRAFSHRFDLLLITRKLPLDPDQHWYWQSDQNAPGSGFNFGSYSNTRVDASFKASMQANGCNSTTRANLFGDVSRQLNADAAAAFLLTPSRFMVARSRVLGLDPSSFAGDFWNMADWRVK